MQRDHSWHKHQVPKPWVCAVQHTGDIQSYKMLGDSLFTFQYSIYILALILILTIVLMLYSTVLLNGTDVYNIYMFTIY
jgi:predicted RND superfamily exporter protein